MRKDVYADILGLLEDKACLHYLGVCDGVQSQSHSGSRGRDLNRV